MAWSTEPSLLSTLPKNLPADFLKEITDGFSPARQLGKGAFGTVYYRGTLKDGTEIAVKRISSGSPVTTDKRFQNEVGNQRSAESLIQSSEEFGLQRIPFKLLAEITHNFSEEAKIGSGSFGQVYKGVLKDGTVIAVKKLRFMPEWLYNKQFENELSYLKQLRHENIVRIVGFCYESERQLTPHEGRLVFAHIVHRILCLEYVPNGSLGKILSEKFSGHNWPVRFKIIKGICVGLKYLHDSNITHYDLKPDNILLDDKMVPKIADFGISRLAAGESNFARTMALLGTLEFMPPEFITKQITSKKFDIFSLGVIIKRIVVSGLCDYMSNSDMDNQAFIEHVHDSWKKKLQETSSHASIEVDSKQVRTCTEIAVVCTEASRYKRPTMQDIMCKLNEVGDPWSQIEEGLLRDGLSVISPVPPEKQFKNEVSKLMAIRHENIVKLIGFCYEIQREVIEYNGRYILVDVTEICLCYENIRSRSLGKYISGESRIGWATRFKIIKAICQGLHFLHKNMVVHMYLVPDNILLDDSMMPKIADFGLSRLYGEEQTRMFTQNVVGAVGYMAPEYLYRGQISMHSDIYNLGLLIIEITTGERNQQSKDISGRNFIDNVRQNWTSDEHIASKYPSLDAGSLHQVKACIKIGLRCVEMRRRNRPSIMEVLDVLDGRRAG